MADLSTLLIGRKLENGWIVKEHVNKSVKDTGGVFSVGFNVERNNVKKNKIEEGFLKVCDFSKIVGAPDFLDRLNEITSAFIYERDLLNVCKRHDRIVNVIEYADIELVGADFNRLQYLIFERGNGSVRSQSDISKRFDTAWSMRSLHHIATGLKQLHSNSIAHQDLKPSNVMVFDEKISKIGDFGHAAIKGNPSPKKEFPILGDPIYAPPEHLYNYLLSDWNHRRFGADTYLLGSMIVFFFTGSGMTTLLAAELNKHHHWSKWAGTYNDILPFLRTAFTKVIKNLEKEFPEILKDDLIMIVRQLCEPDPLLRGDPKNRKINANQYSMERYVSLLDRLAKKAEIHLKK